MKESCQVAGVGSGCDRVGLKGYLFTDQRLERSSNERVELKTMVGAVWMAGGVL